MKSTLLLWLFFAFCATVKQNNLYSLDGMESILASKRIEINTKKMFLDSRTEENHFRFIEKIIIFFLMIEQMLYDNFWSIHH